jgi:hypothetical protein
LPLGRERFAVEAPDSEQLVVGYGAAREAAHALTQRADGWRP